MTLKKEKKKLAEQTDKNMIYYSRYTSRPLMPAAINNTPASVR